MKPREARVYGQPTQPERCPVNLLGSYLAKCPGEGLQKGFYLQPLLHPKSDLWYSKGPIGYHLLDNMVNNIATDAGLSGQYTNHSLQVTTVTRLFHGGVDTALINNQTGHRSDAVTAYKRISDDQLKDVSNKITATQINLDVPNVSVSKLCEPKPGSIYWPGKRQKSWKCMH